MKLITKSAVALLATTALAHAGGVERSAQSVGILFEEGTYAELSFSRVMPNVSGTAVTGAAAALGAVGDLTGDVAPGYNNFSLSYRQDITDQVSVAVVLENHIGADVTYPTNQPYLLAGSTASIDGTSLTILGRYEMPSNFSVYGGARISQAQGQASLQPSTYTLDTETSTAYGYVLGVAYEVPDIALRVSLTYNSEYTHEFESTEGPVPTTSTFDTTIPQSLHLEAQSGIAEDTLLFGSVRWVDWTEFDITPELYTSGTLAAQGIQAGSQLVSYDNDSVTYTLGVARRFTDEFAGLASVVYEKENNGPGSNLAPTDGRFGIGIGGRYTLPSGVDLSGGVQYSVVGNTLTTAGGEFEGNEVVAVGFTIGMNF